MTALLTQDRDSKRAFALRVKDSYARDARDFVAFLDEHALDFTLAGLNAYPGRHEGAGGVTAGHF